MMALRIARLCRDLGVSRTVAQTIAALVYGEDQQ
jgi:predicted transcriptional regulator